MRRFGLWAVCLVLLGLCWFPIRNLWLVDAPDNARGDAFKTSSWILLLTLLSVALAIGYKAVTAKGK